MVMWLSEHMDMVKTELQLFGIHDPVDYFSFHLSPIINLLSRVWLLLKQDNGLSSFLPLNFRSALIVSNFEAFNAVSSHQSRGLQQSHERLAHES